MKTTKKMSLVFASLVIFSAGPSIAGLREDLKYFINHPIDTSIRGGSIGCKGAIAGYAGYLALTKLPRALRSLNCIRYTSFNHFFRTIGARRGPLVKCVVVGSLAYCAYLVGRSCIRDIREHR